MRDSLRHRGPDDAGLYLSADGRAGLVHRRLSILDLSSAGHQPMADPTGRVWITFNGEIYNYAELREELRQHGHVFRTGTDTEVLLAAFREWGEGCLDRLNGMFAFALYDEASQELFVARDRLGIKPLYLFWDGRMLGFASEIRALLAGGLVRPEPEPTAVATFLLRGAVDGETETMFKGVTRLLPGRYLRVSPRGLAEKTYWTLSPMPGEAITADEAPSRFRALFEDSVRLQMRSDVPIGVCLSGGLDSSSIFAVLAQKAGQPIRAFSSVFPGRPEDESHFVRLVVSRFRGEGHEVTPSGDQFLGRVRDLVRILEEPCSHMGVYAQWHVMELAHGHVKVLLDGQGGDELLAGYHAYFDAHLGDLRLGLRAQPTVRNAIGLVREYAHVVARTRNPRLPALLGPRLASRLTGDGRNGSSPAANALTPDARRLAPRPAPREAVFRGELANALARSITGSTLLGLLREEDKIAMAFSIENRVPFLDHRLVEFAMALPGETKIRRGWTKYVLRRALADVLPPEVAWRRDKKGFPSPIGEWLRRDSGAVGDLLLAPRAMARGFLTRQAVRDVLEAHSARRSDHSELIWRWLMTELWFQEWCDAPLKDPTCSARTGGGQSPVPSSTAAQPRHLS